MVTIRELLARLPGLAVVAGAPALDRDVRWVHVSELTDPTPYLRGGELVLSAGVHLPRRAGDLQRYAQRLADFGVAGLGLGITPLLSAVPRALVTACEAHGLPLLEVPPSMPFLAIGEALAAEVEARHLADLRRLNEAQRMLVRAADSAAPVDMVVRRLAEQLHAAVVLIDPDRDRRWAAGPPVAESESESAAVEAVVARVAMRHEQLAVAQRVGERHLLVQAVHADARRFALVVARSGALSAPERGVVSVASSVLSMVLTMSGRGQLPETSPRLGAALTLAVTGAGAGEYEAPAAHAVGAARGGGWQVLACLPGDSVGATGRGPWHERVRSIVGSPLLADDGEGLLAVLPVATNPVRVAAELRAAGSLVGLSDPYPWDQLAAAARQARAARERARLAGANRGLSEGESLLGGAVDVDRARAWAEVMLEPVFRTRPRSATTLLVTLRAWLGRHGNWDRTAEALGVHRNTVRNRIGVLAALLGLDLDDAGVRMQLWFALDWLGPVGPGKT